MKFKQKKNAPYLWSKYVNDKQKQQKRQKNKYLFMIN